MKDIAELMEVKERAPLIKNNGGIDKIVNQTVSPTVSPVNTLAIMINNKQDKLLELEKAIDEELSCELTYLHKANDWRLQPEEIKKELDLSKLPTEKQVNAFLENHLQKDYDAWKTAKQNTAVIRQQLDLINDRISLEKYAIRLELKE